MCADLKHITDHQDLRSLSQLQERKTTAVVAFKSNVHLILSAFLFNEIPKHFWTIILNEYIFVVK